MRANDDCGFGASDYRLAIHIANRPPLDDYPQRRLLQALAPGELHYIVSRTSNHWRKLFNVYAKFLFSLDWPSHIGVTCGSWQEYRDVHLLQDSGAEALLFSPPQYSSPAVVRIVAGKTYAASLCLPRQLQWLDAHFAICEESKTLICPYLDYRQLSNKRIEQLVKLVRPFIAE